MVRKNREFDKLEEESTFLDPDNTRVYKPTVHTFSASTSHGNKKNKQKENRKNEFVLSDLPSTTTSEKLKTIHLNEMQQLEEFHRLERFAFKNGSEAASAPLFSDVNEIY
jgi:hypothetical protein